MDLRDQLAVYEQYVWINMRAITFSFVDQSSSRGLESLLRIFPLSMKL